MENLYILNPGTLRTRRPSVRSRSRRSPLPLPARSPRRNKRRLRELLPLQRVHLVRMLYRHVQRTSVALGRVPSRSLLLLRTARTASHELLLLLPRTARRHAPVQSGRKSAHKAQSAYSRRRWFVCPDDLSRLGAGSTRCSACPQQAATLPAFSTRSRGRSAARVADEFQTAYP